MGIAFKVVGISRERRMKVTRKGFFPILSEIIKKFNFGGNPSFTTHAL